MPPATYHIGETILPMLLTADIEHILPSANGLRAKGDHRALTPGVNAQEKVQNKCFRNVTLKKPTLTVSLGKG